MRQREQGRAGEELITGDQKSGHPNWAIIQIRHAVPGASSGSELLLGSLGLVFHGQKMCYISYNKSKSFQSFL